MKPKRGVYWLDALLLSAAAVALFPVVLVALVPFFLTLGVILPLIALPVWLANATLHGEEERTDRELRHHGHHSPAEVTP